MSYYFHPILALPSTISLDGTNSFRLLMNERNSYIITPTSAWRGPEYLSPESVLSPLELPSGEVKNIYWVDSVWYLLKEPDLDGRVFLRSKDEGATWQPLDDGLEMDRQGNKYRLVPTRMTHQGGTLFLNAGGGINLLGSNDDGKHWHLLSGSMGPQMASPGKIWVRGKTALLGGEAPLDVAYLRRGELDDTLLNWNNELISVAPPDISNRNVQFIEASPFDSSIYAGVEGGLLRSSTDGQSWNWAQRFTGEDGIYPYVQQICFSRFQKNKILIGGFDKANDGVPYLALSNDQGNTWNHIADAYVANSAWRNVLTLCEDLRGRIITAVFDSKAKQVVVGELSELR